MNARLLALVLVGLFSTALVAACDRHGTRRGGDDDDDVAGDGDSDSDGDTDADGDTDVDVDGDSDSDSDSDADADADGRGDYPRGPYGTQMGDTIANYAFETSDGTLSLNDLRQDRAHTIMLIYGGSESCGWCATEGPEVEQLWAEREGDGFLAFGVVMDNGYGGSPTPTDADTFFTESHHAEYPYAASAWEFGAFSIEWADETGVIGLPANVVVDLDTMQILERIDGYPQPGGIPPIVDMYLN